MNLNNIPPMKDSWDKFCSCHASHSTIGVRLTVACDFLEKYADENKEKVRAICDNIMLDLAGHDDE